MSKKAQATKKVPIGQRIGRTTATLTVGAAYKTGRGASRFVKNFGEGAASVWADIKRGYDEAK